MKGLGTRNWTKFIIVQFQVPSPQHPSVLDFPTVLCKLSLTHREGRTLKIIIGSTNEIKAIALRLVLSLPRYKRLTSEPITVHLSDLRLPVFGRENIYRFACERAKIAYETTSKESHLGLGIQCGITEDAEQYFETVSFVLYFPDAKISTISMSCAQIPRKLFMEALRNSESIDAAVARIHGTKISHDPISTLTKDRVSRTSMLIEGLKWLFAQTDWDQYIRLSSAPPT